jgi:hypothetical protein
MKGNCDMAQKHKAVLGIYANYSSVENAVGVLKSAGFRSSDISVLFPQKAGSKEFAHDKGTRSPEGAGEYIQQNSALLQNQICLKI